MDRQKQIGEQGGKLKTFHAFLRACQITWKEAKDL